MTQVAAGDLASMAGGDGLLDSSTQQPPSPEPMMALDGWDSQVPTDGVVEADEIDAIALRSAMSILQMQRERCKVDMRILEETKSRAVAEPEFFVQELKAGRVHHASPRRRLLGAEAVALGSSSSQRVTREASDFPASIRTVAVNEASSVPSTSFSPIPTPQDVVRCPRVNWAKYHIMGEPLDRLHAEQMRRPGAGELQGKNAQAPEALVAAPYRLWADQIEPPCTANGDQKDEADEAD